MEYFVSSQTASTTSCTLRFSERSGVRNMFLASCWVSVEPPSTTPPAKTFFATRAHQADRIDAEMRAEAAVLDGDHRFGHVVRELLDPDRLAARIAAIADQPPVDGEDLHVGRPVGHAPFRGAGQLRGIKGDERRAGDADPDGRDEPQ